MNPTARVAGGTLLALSLMCRPTWTRSDGAMAGAEVYRALQSKQRVRVIVALQEPRGALSSMVARETEISDTRRSVLARLAASDFVLTHQWSTISAVAGDVSAEGLEGLLADPEVRRVDVDPPMYATLAESVPLVHANEAHDMGITGRGVTVAVLDSGADSNHPDLQPAIVAEQCFCANTNGSGCCPNGSTQQSGPGAALDDQGHGTNVSGVIVGRGRVAPVGMAPDASLVSIKVLDRTGGAGSTTQVLSGLDFIARSHPEVKVINISLATANLFGGTSCDSAASFTMAFASSFNALKSRGVSVFASSANNGSSSQIAAPACIASAISVGAVYDGDNGTITFGCTDATSRSDQVACFSNSSVGVDLLAPGAAITAAGNGGGTSTFLGTSQAAPHAAGAAALLLQKNPSFGPDQILARFQSTGVAIADPKNGMTFKRIDVRAALQ